jgi:ribosomal protein L7/L12
MSKYQVTVTSVPDNVVSLVKSLRLVADLGLKDAKDLADYLSRSSSDGCVLVAGIGQGVADHIALLFREAGGAAEVKESPIQAPMLLCPKADEKYAWHWFHGPAPTD